MYSTSISKYGQQICFGFAATFYMCSASLAYAWTSPILFRLQSDPTHPMHLTRAAGSWLVVLFHLGTLAGPLPTGWLMNAYGRKPAIIFGCIPLALSWLLIAHTQNYAIWCVARVLGGCTFGSAYTVLPVYIGEFAAEKIRGLLVFIFVLMLKLGIIGAYTLGPRLSIPVLSYVSLVPVAALLLVSFWLPESAYYLMAAGREEESRKCVRRLNGLRKQLVVTEVERTEMIKIRTTISGSLGSMDALKELYRKPEIRRNLVLLLNYVTCVTVCGSQALLSYAQQIFDTGDKTAVISSANAAILIGLVQVPGLVAASFVVDTCGRRPLVLHSVAVTMLCNCVMCAVFWTRRVYDVAEHDQPLQWLLLAAMIVYFVFYVAGLCAVLSVYLGELFPTNVRAMSAALVVSWLAIGSAVVGKLFQVVGDAWGAESAFGMFAGCGALSFGYLWWALPETKGRTLAEIQARG